MNPSNVSNCKAHATFALTYVPALLRISVVNAFIARRERIGVTPGGCTYLHYELHMMSDNLTERLLRKFATG